MLAYHFLLEDMTAGQGNEPPWIVGEERVYDGALVLCRSGYHWSPTWYDALANAPGPVASIVDVDESVAEIQGGSLKGVSRRRKLITMRNVDRELRLFACDCAERALQRERDAGLEPDHRSWRAIAVARSFANGEASSRDLAAASAAAWAAASAAAVIWQKQHLAERLDPLFAAETLESEAGHE